MPMKEYIAMTNAEFSAAQRLPEHLGWMACHFSCYGTGLTNIPRSLPKGAMVIINDRTPVCGHDPKVILEQLLLLWEAVKPDCFLLDFQRPDATESAQIAAHLVRELPCPVGVSAPYAQPLSCPVLLPPPGLTCTVEQHLQPWLGREVWLELATDAQVATVSSQGCSFFTADATPTDAPVFFDQGVCCSYQTVVNDDSVAFYLRREREELGQLAKAAQALGVTRTVGLYQQLGLDPE